ncbi:MAG: restriction endonuclease subunit S [Zavarzinella sp.]|nr:restriction endonuclease subunit S [Zavarzinella sp.]
MSRWPLVPLGELLRLAPDRVPVDPNQSYPNFGIYSFGRGLFCKPPILGIATSAKSLFRVRKGQFIYSRLFAFEGAYGLVGDEFDGYFVSNEYPTFDFDSDRLLPGFLATFFQSPAAWEEVARLSTGMGDRRRRIQPEQFLTYRVPLPPLAEQRRLVERIEAVAAKVAEAKRLRAEAEEEAAAIEASATNSLFDSSHCPPWETRPLGEIAEIQSGVTLGRTLSGSTVRLPYLRVANVQDGHLDLRVIKEIEVKAEEQDKWRLHPGDLLLTEGGDWDKLGRGTVWRGEIPGCIHQNHIFRVRFDQQRFDPEFLALLTASPYGKQYFQAASKQTTNLASINQRQLKAFPVLRPPLEEQKQLVRSVSVLRDRVNGVLALHSETGAELDALLPAVLDRAFRGEL